MMYLQNNDLDWSFQSVGVTIHDFLFPSEDFLNFLLMLFYVFLLAFCILSCCFYCCKRITSSI
jgi:hypothetical protein